MPITQIPFQDPAAPAEKPQPEQLDLYETSDWETAYRVADAHVVPHLLIQLQDDLARSRKREAIWISVIVHLVFFIVAWNFTFIQKFVGWHTAVAVPVDNLKDKNITALALPPDAQKLARKNPKIATNKDRIATSRRPDLDTNELRKILGTPPPGRPGPSGPQSRQPPQQSVAQNQSPDPQPQAQPQSRPQFESNQTAQSQAPRPNDDFRKYAEGMSAGAAIQQATHAAAARHASGGGQGGSFGINGGERGRHAGSLTIVSDTHGVDFSSYLERMKIAIYQHWFEVLPESVRAPLYKKGKLMIEFTILQDGRLAIANMQILATSGDVALDRAAWGGITGSDPFEPLPPEFIQKGGQHLTLDGAFYYNPDEKDFQ